MYKRSDFQLDVPTIIGNPWRFCKVDTGHMVGKTFSVDGISRI